jgi:hypothetical protein
MTRPIEEGLNQAIETLEACGYTVNAFRRGEDGSPGVVVRSGNEVTTYYATEEILASEQDTDAWLTIVRTLESGVKA